MALWCNLSSASITGTVTPVTGSNITVGFWFQADPRLRSSGAIQEIYQQVGATNGHFRLRIDGGGGGGTIPNFAYGMATSAGSGANVAATIPDALNGQWHHIVLVDAASQVRWWCDGRVRATGDTFRSVGYTGAVTTTISGSTGNNGFNLYDLQVFSRVLNHAEIRAMRDGAWLAPSGRYLIGPGVTGNDYSGHGNHITTVSALTGVFTSSPNPPWVNAGMTYGRWKRHRRPAYVAAGGTSVSLEGVIRA